MGRKKREKKKKKHLVGENTSAVPENTADNPIQPDQPDLSHLSGDWREFYRLVIDRVSVRQDALPPPCER